MGFLELSLIAVGLSMDAFAVSICKGLGMRMINYKQALVIALFFGGFQALMPLLGWLFGVQFQQYITSVDHWIAFGLLAFIGGKMLWDAFHEEKDCTHASDGAIHVENSSETEGLEGGNGGKAKGETDHDEDQKTVNASQTSACGCGPQTSKLDIRELFILAIATSIDALAVGITFAFLEVDIVPAVFLIGIITFALSFMGVIAGNKFGSKYEKPATIVGGIVLILIGLKILLEH